MLTFQLIVHFKRLGSRHIHIEIKLQKAMNGMDRVLCKTDLILIRRHTYKCNTFSDVGFEAFSKSNYVPVWYSQCQFKRVSKGGGFLLCNDLDIIRFSLLPSINQTSFIKQFGLC